MTGGVNHFAKDGNYYYSYEFPTDVQADMETEGAAEEYQALCESFDLSSFIFANNLLVYDHNAAIYEPEYTYPGEHAIYAFSLSNGSKFTLILSKPVRQGADGIWCVERMYDEFDNLYIAMPETDLTAAEYYLQLQAGVDAGHRPGLLDAEEVALTYLAEVWDYARHITNSSIEYINGR
jgi:hypothetical protein